MKKRPWTGVFGEEISDCTIRRLINQTILSLLVSAAVAIFCWFHVIFCFSAIQIFIGRRARAFEWLWHHILQECREKKLAA